MSLKIVLIAIAAFHIELQSANQEEILAPKLTLFPNVSLTPFVGEHISINCEATGVPTPLIETKSTSKPDQYSITRRLGGFDVRWIQKSDEGIYQCRAYSPAGCEIQRIPVFVNEIGSPYVNITVEPSEFVGSVGNTVRLQCTVQADASHKIKWSFFPHQFLPSDVKEANGLLVIPSTTQNHSGIFVCSVICERTRAILGQRGVSVTIGARSSSNTNCTQDSDVDSYKSWIDDMNTLDEQLKNQKKLEDSINQTVKMREFFFQLYLETVTFLSSETQHCRMKNAIFDYFYETAIEAENENPYNISINIKKLLTSFSTYYNNSIFTRREELTNNIRSDKYQCSRPEDCTTNKYDIIFQLVNENPESQKTLKELADVKKMTGITYLYTLQEFFFLASEISIMFPEKNQQRMERAIFRLLGVLSVEKMREMYDEKTFPNNPENCNGVFFSATGGYLKAAEHFAIKGNILIKFEIKPRSINGTVMLLHANETFIALQMINGSMKLFANFGNGPFYTVFRPWNANYFLDDCWHTVRIIKSWDAIILKVDEHDTQFNADPIGYRSINSNHSLYIGGYPSELIVNVTETNEKFIGCVKNLQIYSEKYDLPSFVTFGNVTNCSCLH